MFFIVWKHRRPHCPVWPPVSSRMYYTLASGMSRLDTKLMRCNVCCTVPTGLV